MKKRNRMQRLLTVVLTLALIVTMMPAMNYQWTEEADAATLTQGDKVAEIALKTANKTLTQVQTYFEEQNYKMWKPKYAGDWCAWFISNCARAAGVPTEVVKNTTWAQHSTAKGFYEWAKAQRILRYPDTYTPKVGDICFMQGADKYGHVEIVYKVSGNKIYTIGANAGYAHWSVSTVKKREPFSKGYVAQAYAAINYATLCNHSSINYGACKSCGEIVTKYSPDAKDEGQYITTSTTTLYKTPYTQYTTGKINVAKNTPLKISGSLTVGGKNWYQVGYNGSARYILQSSVKKASASGSTLSINVPDVKVTRGQSMYITGTISSNYSLKKIEYTVSGPGIPAREQKPIKLSEGTNSEKSFVVKGSAIDNNVPCAKLTGSGTLNITATDWTDKTVTKEVALIVSGSKQKIKQPTINVQDIDGGKKVTIRQAQNGATLKYTYGATSKSTTSTEVSFTLKSSMNVTASSSKSGFIASDTAKKYVTITQLPEPTFTIDQVQTDAYVDIKCTDSNAELYYAIDKDSGYKKYTGTFKAPNMSTIYAYAKRKGYVNSDKATQEVEVTIPNRPVARVISGDRNVAAGKTVTIGWEADKKASAYDVTVYYEGEKIEERSTKENAATITLKDIGEYTITVSAGNEAGISAESEAVTVNAKDKVHLKFVDADIEQRNEEGTLETITGSVIGELTLDYGDYAELFDEPSRKGYTFAGWEDVSNGVVSMNAYTKTPVKEDAVYRATYTKKIYTVKFYDTDGSLIETQNVAYGDSASEEKAIASLKSTDENHVFAGWSLVRVSDETSKGNLQEVDADMSLQAIVKWKNADLPVRITIRSAEANSDMSIHPVIDIATDETQEFSFYLVAALTAEKNGVKKTVYVDRQIFTVPAGTNGIQIGAEGSGYAFDLKTKGINLSAVSNIEVMALECREDNSTGGAYSEIARLAVDYDAHWSEPSEWTTEKPQEQTNRVIEEKVQYSGRNLETKYSSAASMEGYTKARTEYYNETSGKWTTSHSYSYGGWRTSAPSTGTSDKGTYKSVVTKDSKTTYRGYAYYCGCKKWCWKNNGGVCKYCGGKTKYLLTVYSSTSLANSGYIKDASDASFTLSSNTIKTVSSGKLGQIYAISYNGSNVSSFTCNAVTKKIYLWSQSNGTVYRTKTEKVRNAFTRYGEGSDWSDVKPTADRIDTRTVYRYTDLIVTPASSEDISGESRHYEGRLNTNEDLAGKVATVMIYQANNFDPNKYQMQYVDQITLGTDNTYSFDYILKEEPTIESGNYIISLGVEGGTGLVTVGMIEAPKREYAVSLFYLNAEGEKEYLIENQTVKENGNLDLSNITIPQKAGYYFIGWSERTTNITSNCEIEAIYLPVQNAVVFVDWINQTIEVQHALTGEKIAAPGVTQDMQGYTFKNWKLPDGTTAAMDEEITVTGDMIIIADYDTITYEVKFLNEDGSVLSTQNVVYGHAANPPEAPAVKTGKVFLGWSEENAWWNVTSDMEVTPLVVYELTAETPEAIINGINDYIENDIELRAEEGAKIYYTTDGTDPQIPNEDGTFDSETTTKEYVEGGLNFTEDTTIKVIAASEGKNVSEILEVFFEYNTEEEYSPDQIWEEIGTYNVVAEANKEIVLNLKLDENPGLMGYHFLIECDRNTFYVDYDEENGLVCEAGNASANGNLFASEYEDSGWQILWFATEENYNKGSLFKLTLKAAEDAETGVYPIKVSYAKANTLTADALETELNINKVNLDIESNANLLGDANGDGSVTAMDVVRIARYVVGLAEIPTEREYLADVNRDGKITIADAILLARSIVGLEQVS